MGGMIGLALRRSVTILVAIQGIALLSWLAVRRLGARGRRVDPAVARRSFELAIVPRAIMGIGVAMANAILLLTVAEYRRREGASASDAARQGASRRWRPILRTSAARIAGLFPLALGWGEAGALGYPVKLTAEN